MAINMKQIFVRTMWDLVKEKPLKKISVTDVVRCSGASKATFYKYFEDINALIGYIYFQEVLGVMQDHNLMHSESELRIGFFNRIMEHKDFFGQAFLMVGQNCLSSYAKKYCRDWYAKRLGFYYGESKIPKQVLFAVDFYTNGHIALIQDWIAGGMKESPQELADYEEMCLPEVLKVLFHDKKWVEMLA